MTDTITPSSLWQGSAVAGSRWTAEQLAVLRKEGRDPERVNTATVRRWPKVNAADWTMPVNPVDLVLPRLAITRNGQRAKVITPAGAVQWLDIVHG